VTYDDFITHLLFVFHTHVGASYARDGRHSQPTGSVVAICTFST